MPQQPFNGDNNLNNNGDDQENADEDVEEWEQDGHWAMQQHNNNWAEMDAKLVLEHANQEEIDLELPLHDGISSFTTTVSLSDGAFSNNAPLDGLVPSDEVNQVQHVLPDQ